MIYVLNIKQKETIVVGLYEKKGKYEIKEIFTEPFGYSEYLSSPQIPGQIFERIENHTFHKYIVVLSDGILVTGQIMKEQYANRPPNPDNDYTDLYDRCPSLIPRGLKAENYNWSLLQYAVENKNQYYLSVAYFLKPLKQKIQEFFDFFEVQFFGIYTDISVFQILIDPKYNRCILEITPGRYAYYTEQGILVYDNTKATKAAATEFLMALSDESFNLPKLQGVVPTLLTIEDLTNFDIALPSTGYFLENSQKEIYAAIGAYELLVGSSQRRKQDNTINKAGGEKDVPGNTIRQLFAKIGGR